MELDLIKNEAKAWAHERAQQDVAKYEGSLQEKQRKIDERIAELQMEEARKRLAAKKREEEKAYQRYME